MLPRDRKPLPKLFTHKCFRYDNLHPTSLSNLSSVCAGTQCFLGIKCKRHFDLVVWTVRPTEPVKQITFTQRYGNESCCEKIKNDNNAFSAFELWHICELFTLTEAIVKIPMALEIESNKSYHHRRRRHNRRNEVLEKLSSFLHLFLSCCTILAAAAAAAAATTITGTLTTKFFDSALSNLICLKWFFEFRD
ncbi:hypothetical protein GQX74_014423 [Glossina fuscipes]|nr:hypothetical protein GQX74_014423 [Glossina fuscipes]